ncbi:hypothetical protein BKA65DRAFT_69077 [Rhexocercosporidium sp. MPI-PUGE-AT-0058]|nr:hypothetical protein BKA65DRAFT_69077 [Rhexocercosporidium sp. MPI-PUGE-AT-0058]
MLRDILSMEVIMGQLKPFLKQQEGMNELQNGENDGLKTATVDCSKIVKNMRRRIEDPKTDEMKLKKLRQDLMDSKQTLSIALGKSTLMEVRALAQRSDLQHQQTHELLRQANFTSQETNSSTRIRVERIDKAQSGNEDCRDEFVDSWLDIVSTIGEPGHHDIEDCLPTIHPDLAQESAKVVPASSLEATYFELPEMSRDQYIRETFPFGECHGYLVLGVSVPRSIWANFGRDVEPREGLDEFTLRRYTAVTAKPENFTKRGFRLRQQSLHRDIQRLIAIPIDKDEVASYEVTEKVKNVIDDVRALVKNSGGHDSWKRIVVGFFVSPGAFGKKISPKECSNCIFTDIGILAEWPVKVTSPTSVNSPFWGNHGPSSVRFIRGEGEKQTISEKQDVEAHLYEFTTSLSPKINAETERQDGVDNGEIPIQFLLCIGLDIGGWIKAFQKALDADMCFRRAEEWDTGGYGYDMVPENRSGKA